ncbi:hypothetical protein AYO40_03940 [Planctomycetaceae bacterium SCGC AG-212-D15]|nr:hypothetical protein AYO40_03940 [Planctomycetaceae bacterium SCGC AG-212-D15]
MPEIIRCPQCQRELQVPEEFIGRPVKCPSCGLNFVTRSEAAPQPLPRVGEVTYAHSEAADPPPRTPQEVERARKAVFPAALCLLIVSCLCLFVDVLLIHQAATFSREEAEESLEDFPPGPMRDSIEHMLDRAAEPETLRVMVFCASTLGIFSLVSILGAIQMMRLRSWGLALTASILSLIHFDHCCCIPFNMAVGLWALLVLARADVRSIFE